MDKQEIINRKMVFDKQQRAKGAYPGLPPLEIYGITDKHGELTIEDILNEIHNR